MTDKSWEVRYAEFLERVMANAVAGGDPKPLQEELELLLAEQPAEKKKKKNGTKG